jgi:hypothetical protein
MNIRTPGRSTVAVFAVAASVAGSVPALAASTASASAPGTCPNKTFAVKPVGDPTLHIPVKAITVSGGVSCALADKVIAAGLAGKTPAGWKSVPAHFKVPSGFVPTELKDGGKTIKWGNPGG